MNAAFGAVSAGGVGTPLLEVDQSGGGPSALVANHPVGKAGGVTVSKFSISATGCEQGLWHEGVDLGAALELSIEGGISLSPEADSARMTACEELTSSNAAAPAAVNKIIQSTFRNRFGRSERLGVSMLAVASSQGFYLNRKRTVNASVAHSVILADRRE